MRVVIADDDLLVRAGLAAPLLHAGIEIAPQAAAPDELLDPVAAHDPTSRSSISACLRTHTDEGLRAAREIRAQHPRRSAS